MNVVSLLLLIIYLFYIALASYVELKVFLKQLNTGINDIACNLLLKLIFFSFRDLKTNGCHWFHSHLKHRFKDFATANVVSSTAFKGTNVRRFGVRYFSFPLTILDFVYYSLSI